MTGKPIPQQFFSRDTTLVARELLGKFLVRRYRGKSIFGMITETEAYDGFYDRASHASRGRTARNAPMFGPPGCWYVYFTYGMHWMLNVVTRDKDYPAAVLIRGMEGIWGPARVTKALRIDKSLNGKLAARHSGLWIEDRGVRVISAQMKKTPRIGVHYAGPYWAKKPWRFVLSPNRSVSVRA